MAQEYDYDVAFSFAGEDRGVVESLAGRLKQQNVSVFYDRDKQAEMWGENLQEYLTDIYLKRARFCIMFISEAYAEKMWTRHERRTARASAMQQKRAYVLPIRLDRTELEGLLPSVAYITFSDHTEDEIVGMILEKLDTGGPEPERSSMAAPSFNIAMPRVKKTFNQRERDVFARMAFNTISNYFEQGLKQLERHDSDIAADFDPVHRSKFLARVYVKGEPANTCKIWLGAGWGGRGGDDHISYYEGQSVNRDRDDATNDMISVTDDGHMLGLENQGFGQFRMGSQRTGLLSPEQAAELLWQRFTERLSVR
jgi:TIR domain